MSTGRFLEGVVQQLRTQLGAEPTDAELLARYAAQRDEAAFTALVQRHGALVFGVACRQLPDRQQAEDVFQATFLALAKSAGRLGGRPSLAAWLYTVALRQARKARLRFARRQQLERTAPVLLSAVPDPLAEISGRELVGLIDQELTRLPETYRLPLLLCCVEGLSREEAARQLNWSAGMVKGRLERGRRLLAARLARRGVVPSTLLLASLGMTVVPADLLARTAGLAVEPGSKAVPAAVLALARLEGPRRLLLISAIVGAVAVAGVLGLVVGAGPKPAAPPPSAGPHQKVAAATDDPLPAGSTRRFGTARFRLGTRIDVLAVSADGRLAVAASGNHWLGSAQAFDLTTGRRLYRIKDSIPFVEAVALSPTGNTLATKQSDGVYLRDSQTGAVRGRLPFGQANTRIITQWLAFTPDGKAVAVTIAGKAIALFDVESGKLRHSFVHDNAIFAVAFSPDGRLMAAGGYDGTGNGYFGRLWEVATGKDLRHFNCGRGGLRTLAFSPDGHTLAGGGDDARLRLWDVATGQEKRVFPPDGTRIRSVAWAPDGRTVAAAGLSIRLYDPATGRSRLQIPCLAVGLHFRADGKVLTAAVAGAIDRWDTATGRALTPQDASDGVVDQLIVTPDGPRLITRDQSPAIHLWDVATGTQQASLGCSYGQGMALSPDGRFLVWPLLDRTIHYRDPRRPYGLFDGNRLQLYDLKAGHSVERFAGFEGNADDLDFLPDGQTLLTVDHGAGTARLWDMSSGKMKRMFSVLPDVKQSPCSVWRCLLSPDGRTLAVAYDPSSNFGLVSAATPIRLWDVATGKARHELSGHRSQVHALAFSPDSRLLVSSANPRGSAGLGAFAAGESVRVWDVTTGQPLAAVPNGLPTGAASAAFAPDGRTLATAMVDGPIQLWETATWKLRTQFRGHRHGVTALTFAPAGQLYSGSVDTTVLAWNPRPPETHNVPLTAAWDALARPDAGQAFRAAGRLLATPDATLSLLTQKLRPAARVDENRIAALIADLDSPRFVTRERASKELRLLGLSAAAALRQARATSSSAEVRRRASRLLDELTQSAVPPEQLRTLRSIEVLEWLATPPARQLLKRLATGPRSDRTAQAARAALGRLVPSRGPKGGE